MPSRKHEMVVQMVRDRPALAADLLRCVRAGLIPPFDDARLESGDLSEHAPAAYHADALVTLHGDGGTFAVVVELQRKKDPRKHFSWPTYLATARARLECPVILLVICPKRTVARWARQSIALGHPDLVLTPLVLGPEEVPVVTTADGDNIAPELTAISAAIHGAGPDGEKVLSALLESALKARSEQGNIYLDEVYAVLPPAARKLMEALMETKNREYKSEFARRYFSEGEARGEARGEAKAVLAFLSARGIEVSERDRVRISECTDLAQLEEWVRLAATARSVADLFTP
jgi:hypothetical protein